MRLRRLTVRFFLNDILGDFVVQNASNSGVGRAVIQIAKILDIGTINIVRQRPNVQELKDDLMQLGATYVLVDEDLKKPEIREWFEQPGMARHLRLGLNCVGGRSAVDIAKVLTYVRSHKCALLISTFCVMIEREVHL